MEPVIPSKKKLFRLKMMAAAHKLGRADGLATEADFVDHITNGKLGVLLEIVYAESLIQEARALIGLPPTLRFRPLPQPSMN